MGSFPIGGGDPEDADEDEVKPGLVGQGDATGRCWDGNAAMRGVKSR